MGTCVKEVTPWEPAGKRAALKRNRPQPGAKEAKKRKAPSKFGVSVPEPGKTYLGRRKKYQIVGLSFLWTHIEITRSSGPHRTQVPNLVLIRS